MEYALQRARQKAWRRMPRIAAIGLAAPVFTCLPAHAEIMYTVGLAAGAAPRYQGSKEYQVLGAPPC